MILDQNVIVGVLAVSILCLTADIFHLRYTLRKVFKDKNCGDFGKTVASINNDVKELGKFRTDIEAYMKNVEKRLKRSTQATETVRFNAFRGDGLGGSTGGGQSFATAFLNEDGDGAILSSIYTRDRVSVFSKSLSKFNSESTLTEEEKRAVSLAKAKLSARQ